MAANTTISCNWLSAKSAVEDIHVGQLNVTDVVAQCANVCELLFETNGAEILGPGIMVSALIQAILFGVFGVSLPVTVWLLNKHRTAKVAQMTKFLRKIQELVLETNGFFTLSLLFTAIFTCTKAADPSIVEFTFISRLLEYQRYYLLGLVLSQSADQSLNDIQIPGTMLFYYYVLLLAQYATSCSTGISNHNVYKTLSRGCRQQHQFVDVFSSVTTSGETAKGVGIGLAFGVGIMILIAVGVIYRESIPGFLARAWKALEKIVPSWLKKHKHSIFNVALVGIYTLNIPLNIHLLYNLRASILRMAGPQSMQATEWGYGQTTAILLWFPLFFYATKEMIKYMRCPSTSGPKNASLEQKQSFPLPIAKGNSPAYHVDFPLSGAEKYDSETDDFATDGLRRTSSGLEAQRSRAMFTT